MLSKLSVKPQLTEDKEKITDEVGKEETLERRIKRQGMNTHAENSVPCVFATACQVWGTVPGVLGVSETIETFSLISIAYRVTTIEILSAFLLFNIQLFKTAVNIVGHCGFTAKSRLITSWYLLPFLISPWHRTASKWHKNSNTWFLAL